MVAAVVSRQLETTGDRMMPFRSVGRHVRRNAIVWNDLVSLVRLEAAASSSNAEQRSDVNHLKPAAEPIKPESSSRACLEDDPCMQKQGPLHYVYIHGNGDEDDQSTISSSSIDRITSPISPPSSPRRFPLSGVPFEVYVTMSPPSINLERKTYAWEAVKEEEEAGDEDPLSSPNFPPLWVEVEKAREPLPVCVEGELSPRCVSDGVPMASLPTGELSPPMLPWLSFDPKEGCCNETCSLEYSVDETFEPVTVELEICG